MKTRIERKKNVAFRQKWSSAWNKEMKEIDKWKNEYMQ